MPDVQNRAPGTVAHAVLVCKHEVTVERNSLNKAEQSRIAMKDTAWCDRCGAFKATKTSWTQSPFS